MFQGSRQFGAQIVFINTILNSFGEINVVIAHVDFVAREVTKMIQNTL